MWKIKKEKEDYLTFSDQKVLLKIYSDILSASFKHRKKIKDNNKLGL